MQSILERNKVKSKFDPVMPRNYQGINIEVIRATEAFISKNISHNVASEIERLVENTIMDSIQQTAKITAYVKIKQETYDYIDKLNGAQQEFLKSKIDNEMPGLDQSLEKALMSAAKERAKIEAYVEKKQWASSAEAAAASTQKEVGDFSNNNSSPQVFVAKLNQERSGAKQPQSQK